jgi:excisionase family DNA binding protein
VRGLAKEAKKAQAAQDLLTPAAVAARLGLSRAHIYTLAAAGEIPSIKLRRAVRFDPADVEAYVRKHRREAA